MSKRSNFERKKKDQYYTIDPLAAQVLGPYVSGSTFAEPCCGNGDLVAALEAQGLRCLWESDIDPGPNYDVDGFSYFIMDAFDLEGAYLTGIRYIITNPPYERKVLLPMIEHFTSLLPTWLLLPADLMHNQYFGPYVKNCAKIVSIGRLYWEDNKRKGTDNYAWYFFPKRGWSDDTVFVGRTA